MTRAIANPETGERIEFGPSTEDVLRFGYTLQPGGDAVGRFDHVHPWQTDTIQIEIGRLVVRVDGDEWTATSGTRFEIPPGTPHTLRNDGRDEMRASIEIRPALDIASFFETTYGLACEGKTLRWELPGPLQLAVLVDEYGDQLPFAGVPRSVQRGVAAVLAPIGRLAGRRARYPRFADRNVPEP